MTALSCWVPVSAVDKLCAVAARRGLSLSQVTSNVLIMALHQSPQTPPTHPSR
jgi:hypothetical protein